MKKMKWIEREREGEGERKGGGDRDRQIERERVIDIERDTEAGIEKDRQTDIQRCEWIDSVGVKQKGKAKNKHYRSYAQMCVPRALCLFSLLS